MVNYTMIDNHSFAAAMLCNCSTLLLMMYTPVPSLTLNNQHRHLHLAEVHAVTFSLETDPAHADHFSHMLTAFAFVYGATHWKSVLCRLISRATSAQHAVYRSVQNCGRAGTSESAQAYGILSDVIANLNSYK